MIRQIFFIEDDKKINNLQVNELTKYLESCGYTTKVQANIDIITTYTCGEDIIQAHQITVKNFKEEEDGYIIVSKIKASVKKGDICVVVVDLCLNGNQTTGKDLAVKIEHDCKENVKVQIVSSRLFSLSATDRETINKINIIFFCRPVVQRGEEWIFNDRETTMFTAKKKLEGVGIKIPDPKDKNITKLKAKVIESVNSLNRKEQFFGCILAEVLF